MSSGRKPYEGSVKGLIEVELGKNSRVSMHFLFFNILKGPKKNYLKLFLTHVHCAEKMVCHEEERLIRGAPKAYFELSYVKIPTKECTFYSLIS